MKNCHRFERSESSLAGDASSGEDQRRMDGLVTGVGTGRREKRLERNRESARKCRKKRKAYVGDLEDNVQSLTEDNAMLVLENKRLYALLAQLQGSSDAHDDYLPDSSTRKRAKSEFGVPMVHDFSESAVHATLSPQQEILFPLAILTTTLFMTLTTTLSMATNQATLALALVAQEYSARGQHAPLLKPSPSALSSPNPWTTS